MDDLVGGDPEHFPLHIWHAAEVPETAPDNQPKIGKEKNKEYAVTLAHQGTS